MRIKRLKLSGFKSFVEPAELRIEPGLTGVVGPNGCGKSNLLEAIRWVMGESSAKSLRGGGMEDVIFAGTTQRPARDFAEVSLLVERTEGAAGQDLEAEVVRRIERGAGSAYRINGRDVRQKDVGLLFADAATGAHSPALVSQGKIAAVISAKPAERRAMLEEAAGIAGLHVRRKDAEQKLRATETNLTRLDELIGDMEARAGQLRRQAKAAERYRTLSTAIRLAEARLIFARWRDAAAAADAAKAEAVAAETQVAERSQAQSAAETAQAMSIETLGAARTAAEKARDTASEIGHRLSAARAQRGAIERRLSDLDRQRATIADDRGREDILAVDAAEALKRLAEEEKALDTGLKAAAEQVAGLDRQLAAYETASQAAEVDLARATAAEAAEQAELRVAQAALAAAKMRLARAQQASDRVATEAAQIGDVAPLTARRDAAIVARTDAEATIEAAGRAAADAEGRREAAVADRERGEAAASSVKAALAALDAEARALVKGFEGKRGGAGIKAAPGYERALAAALGDEIEAPVTADAGWTGADIVSGDPSLDPRLTPLAPHVSAPAALARRLAQVGFVESDDGRIVLAVGQRLVTRDGAMRRWDGFRARDVGAAAAERLIRLNRLAEIELALPRAQAAVADAAARMVVLAQEFGAAKAAGDAARAARTLAEGVMRTAIRDEDAAGTAIERLALQRGAIEQRVALAKAEQEEAQATTTVAETALAALPDGSGVAADVRRLRAASDAARSTLAQARADAATVAQRIEADRRRIEAARSEARGWRTRAGDAGRRIAEMDRRAAAIEAEAASIAGRPEQLDRDIASLDTGSRDAVQAAETTRTAERTAEAELRQRELQSRAAAEALSAARETRAAAAARAENQELRRVEMGRISGERFECPAPVLPERVGFAGAEVGDANAESQTLERQTAERERLGPVNLVAESELTEIEAERAKNVAEREELGQAIHRLRGSIGSLNREGRARLLAAFEAVDVHFRRLFTTLFGGGQAHLALIDSDDPLEAGLEIMAQPPGKRLGSLTLLSGGEQALTAVALIFALFLTNPAPICVLDEVDAPLDDANIERFCDLLDEMTRVTDTRYLIVTHNAVTMSRMHRLFGVTMVERGVSRLVSVDLGGAETLLAAE